MEAYWVTYWSNAQTGLICGSKLIANVVCMCVCPKIYIRHALSKKFTVAPRSQTNRNVFSARLNRSVDKSAERREDGVPYLLKLCIIICRYMSYITHISKSVVVYHGKQTLYC